MDTTREVAVKGAVIMKDTRLDALLTASRDTRHDSSEFTDRVMTAIQSSEILSSRLRSMNVTNRETFFMKIKHLPKFAIIAIALAALALLSTGVYAAYQLLWSKPSVEVSTSPTSASGRKEVTLSASNCGNRGLAERYELKKNAIITEAQVADVVKAQCELQAINTWVEDSFPQPIPPDPMGSVKTYDEKHSRASMAVQLQAKDATSVTFAAQTKYGVPEETLSIGKDVLFIADGSVVTADKIAVGDPVVYVSVDTIHMTPSPDCTEQHCSSSGSTASKELKAIIKLSYSFEKYDPLAWQSLAERTACEGNAADSCVNGASIDLYMGNGVASGDNKYKEIQGAITEINGKTVKLRSSSGTIFTVTTKEDVIEEFNTKRSPLYENKLIKVGSSLAVTYGEKQSQSSKVITPAMLLRVNFQLEMVSKGDSLKPY